MNSKLADVIEAGKALAAADRLEAAHQLLLSVDVDTNATQSEIDEAWDDAVTRRVDDVRNGKAHLIDGAQAHAQLRAEVAARRK